MEHDTSAKKDEFYIIQMQEFAIQAEETIDAETTRYSGSWRRNPKT